MTEEFFAEATGRGGVHRDGAGNALLVPRGMPLDLDVDMRPAYTAASALADFISDMEHVNRWRMRYLARAMGMYEDLAALAGLEVYTTGFGKGDSRENTRSGRALDSIITRALDRVGILEKADYGTAVHKATEPGDQGYVPERMRADVDAFYECVRVNGIRIVATEVFTANDAVMSAGTFDHLVWVPGYGFCIADKKTGKMDPWHFGVQLSVYGNGDVYDRETNERLSFLQAFGTPLNRDVGVIFAIGDGQCRLRKVNLEVGWKGAQTAAAARDYNATPDLLTDLEVGRALKQERDELGSQIMQAGSREQINVIWDAHRHLWTDDLSQIAKHRISELAA